MASVWLLIVNVGLFMTAANSTDVPQSGIDPSYYNSKMISVINILKETFSTEIRNNENILLSSVPLVIDVTFIYDALGEEAKQQVRDSNPLFDLKRSPLKIIVDVKLSRSLSNEMEFTTYFYETGMELNGKNRIRLLVDKLLPPNNRFILIAPFVIDTMATRFKISGSSSITCEDRICPIREILLSNPPFAILTSSNWKVTSVAGFQWTAPISFAISETSSIEIYAVEGVMGCEHAALRYTNGCSAYILRLPYKSDFSLIFVLAYGNEEVCRSSENLWENVLSLNFNDLEYEQEHIFVSIPIFKVSATIDLRMKLKGTAFERAFDQESSGLFEALAFQEAEVSFNPQVAQNLSQSHWIADIGSFEVRRPFFFALFHVSSPAPVVAGLISNPATK